MVPIRQMLVALLLFSLSVKSSASMPTEYELPDWYTSLNLGSHKGAVLILPGQGVTGRARYSYIENQNEVIIEWFYHVTGLQHSPMGDSQGRASCIQKIAVGFAPTDVVGIGARHMAVAGVTKAGRTVVKVFEFGSFSPPAVFTQPGGPPPVVPELSVPVASIETVFDRDTGGNHIGVLFQNRGLVVDDVTTELFMYFEDSHEIYGLDLASSQVRLLASPTGSTSALAVPQLASEAYEVVHDARTGNGECVYWFTKGYPHNTLVFVDEDCDGNLDDVKEIVPALWGASGYGDVDSYPDGWMSAR